MAVPCCHKNLHRQMSGIAPPVPLGPLMRHGILKQRQIDMVTDTFRAQVSVEGRVRIDGVRVLMEEEAA